MIYQRVTSKVKHVQDNGGMIFKKTVIERTKYSSEGPKKIDNEPGDYLSGVFKKIIRKLADYFFTTLDEETHIIRKQDFVYFPKIKCYIDIIFWANIY